MGWREKDDILVDALYSFFMYLNEATRQDLAFLSSLTSETGTFI